tara:strand:+ start:56 stop:406 length:351 start_codon:yes stop_codon:yes gene_type:complete
VESCPNIAGGEIRRRLNIGYMGLAFTIVTIAYIIILKQDHLRFIVFFPGIIMTITFFEAWDKTCIVNAYFGIKNMGEKNHRERDADSLKVQRLQSVKIVVKAVLSAAILTAIIYLI